MSFLKCPPGKGPAEGERINREGCKTQRACIPAREGAGRPVGLGVPLLQTGSGHTLSHEALKGTASSGGVSSPPPRKGKCGPYPDLRLGDVASCPPGGARVRIPPPEGPLSPFQRACVTPRRVPRRGHTPAQEGTYLAVGLCPPPTKFSVPRSLHLFLHPAIPNAPSPRG